eukprot:TRINITY_DN5785_c0_g1_i2.p1 TRINITY_DN5785_c0_g1~~TRINITY_DN5785_c0_g1_i2.p1  ORF type:complete len:351 (-),score=63.23 TRINITY_DN5785_c0_g1_i2:24-1076(-)
MQSVAEDVLTGGAEDKVEDNTAGGRAEDDVEGGAEGATEDDVEGTAEEEELKAIAVQQRLSNLLVLPPNQFCAECQEPDPCWASVTLGVFVCLRCSGIHRSLGVHKSFVRSVTLDTWKEEQVDVMEQLGNASVNARLLSHYPPGDALPTPESSDEEMRAFIHAKYIEGSFTSEAERKLMETSLASTEPKSQVMREFLTAVVVGTKRVTDSPSDKGYTVYDIDVQVRPISSVLSLNMFVFGASQYNNCHHSYDQNLPCIDKHGQTNLDAFATSAFSIERRYSDFEKLFKHLKALSIPRLPPMPEKTFFARFDDSTIQERVDRFNEILDWCGKSSFVRSHREFLLFLQPRTP